MPRINYSVKAQLSAAGPPGLVAGIYYRRMALDGGHCRPRASQLWATITASSVYFFLGSHHFGSYMVLESHDDHRVSTKVITFLLQAAIMRVGDLGRVVAGAGFTHVNSLHFVCIFPTL